MTEEETGVPEVKPATAAEILSVWGRGPKEPFDIPGAGRVWVHGLRDDEVIALFENAERDPDNPGEMKDPYLRAKLVQKCVRNAAGAPLFSEGDVMKIAGANRLQFVGVYSLCEKLSAIGGVADEEILKNYVATLTSGS
jgi:hypothetical protein